MGFFGSENSLEPVQSTVRKRQRDEEPPIRAATAAEMAAATQRRDRQGAQAPVRPVAAKAAAHQAGEPDAVAKLHGLYTADRGKARVYFNDYQQKSEVMRATTAKITTKLDDRQTVTAMLDLAKERGWETVKLRGTTDFKREAWQQAQQRGIKAEGYTPNQTDLQEAAQRKQAAAPAAPKAAEASPARTVSAEPARQSVNAPKAAQTAAPAEAAGELQRQRAAEKKVVWGAVEATGKQAREQDVVKQAQKPTAVAKPKSAAEAA